MPRGPYLTPKVKKLIAQIYGEDRQVRPTKAREELLKRMKRDGLDSIFGSDYPGISTVSKELKELRLNDEARSPESKGLDEPWTLSSLTKYPIAPEALPAAMREWTERVTQGEPLTIRQALWIGRLYYIARENEVALRFLARSYAEAEMLRELFGKSHRTLWEELLCDSTSYCLITGDMKPFQALIGNLKETAPELYEEYLKVASDMWYELPSYTEPLRADAVAEILRNEAQQEARNEREHTAKKQE